MKRPHMNMSESGPGYEEYEHEINAYERAQEDAFDRERDETEEQEESFNHFNT